MRIADMNWMQVDQHVKRDRRAVLPIGSTEQHGQLSLCVDAILAERVSVEAAQPLEVPVFPALNYGLTPNFVDFPGTVTLRLSTLCAPCSTAWFTAASGRSSSSMVMAATGPPTAPFSSGSTGIAACR